MREQKSGTLIGFTSGAFAGSRRPGQLPAAKGGIVSLVRSAAAGLYKYGVTANAIAPVARTRMSANVPRTSRSATPRTSPRWSSTYCPTRPEHHRAGVHGERRQDRRWNQPHEVRMRKDGRWTPEEIEARFDDVGQERMPLIDMIELAKAAEAKATES